LYERLSQCSREVGRLLDQVGDDSGRHLAWPADDGRHTEAAFQRRALASGERRLAAVGPCEILRTVVGREDHDGVVVEAVVGQILHDRADDVIELRQLQPWKMAIESCWARERG